jgi:predicted small integral membrane protein
MDGGTDARGHRGAVTDALTSARGWSGIQLAVLAFIGFCGVITDGRPDLPRWLQTTSAVLSLLALALACVAVFLVASVAWPLEPPGVDPSGGSPDAAPTGRRRLRLGAVLTFAAVAVMALAASANWWPVAGDDRAADGGSDSAALPLIEVRDGVGNRWCGRLVASGSGTVLLATSRGDTELALARLDALAPVERC